MHSIRELKNLKGKKVLVRADLNVSIQKGKVVDPFRILKIIPTIEYLRKQGAIVIIISHIESPVSPTLLPVTKILQKYFPISFIPTKDFKSIKMILSHAEPKTVVLLENIRQFAGEKKNDPVFAKKLSTIADIYVNDAFPVSHRVHASIVGLPKFLPSYAGMQLEKEIKALSKMFTPKHPFLVILGGAKFDTKLPLLRKYIPLADYLFIGGALSNQVFKEHGFETGISLIEKKNFGLVDMVKNKKILLPIDVCVVAGNKKRNTFPDEVKTNENMVDVGIASTKLLIEQVKKAKYILWNGPLGKTNYYHATKKILDAIAHSKAISIIGGGDTVEVISKYKMEQNFTFVSTGGGATLQFLSEGTLPGIDALG